jgi:adenosylcobinamide kinase/adenosylcobinamide-phosphate guanylyltransferase
MKPQTRRAPFILVTGGCRSGKSQFAIDLAKRLGRRIAYVATCRVADREMRQRVSRHRHARPAQWRTLEAPADPVRAITQLDGRIDGLVLDCLTMYVASLLMRRDSDATIETQIQRLCETCRGLGRPIIVVTNEVGSGIVPIHRLGRRFRDLAGLANQLVARHADQVVWMVAGIPVQIKGATGLVAGLRPHS